MKKNITVLIPNAPSTSNIGDMAILEASLATVKNYCHNANVIVHSMEYEKRITPQNKPSIYYLVGFKSINYFIRIIRLVELFWVLLFYRINKKISIIKKSIFFDLIDDYFNADIIFFIGGGYLRSKKGITQTVNLCFDFLLFFISSTTKAKVIIGPASFGPFAYSWQEKLAIFLFKSVDYIILREEISYKKIKDQLNNVLLLADQALYLKKIEKIRTDSTKKILGFTIRKWLSDNKQTQFEINVALALQKFCIKNNYLLQPIIQVSNPKYEYDDLAVNSVITSIDKSKITVLPTKKIMSVEDACDTYSGIDLLLGMRMHSNILSATQETPFVAISYEHKTEGIANMLGLGDYCISCENVNENNLSFLLEKAEKNLHYLKSQIKRSIKNIKITESDTWRKILSLD